jgi:transcriptional regulator GlxA family with amidase domain
MEGEESLRKLPISHRIARAEEIARQNIATAFGVQEFAEAAGLSRSRFSVAYQNHRGTSAGCFLRRLRMERAVDLLKFSREPIAVVGKMVGYPEPTGFGRAFRRHTGLSPSLYRASARKVRVSPAEAIPPLHEPIGR